MKHILYIIALGLLPILSTAQASQPSIIDKVNVTKSKAIYLGLTQPVSDLDPNRKHSPEKRKSWKSKRRIPYNFKGRGKSKVMYPDLEHQGADPLRQTSALNNLRSSISTDPIVNIDGITAGTSPTDPSGDIGTNYYVQAINATEIAVYEKDGTMVTEFSAAALWTTVNGNSLGDPIVLFDEQTDQWIITEFTGPTDLLIAVSETTDPLGSYHVYRFSAPAFPDYPKYAIWSDHLVVTSNEEQSGTGTLHQYFIDREPLMSGDGDVNMQRVEIVGNPNTEAGFFVSTPVDWNGTLEPLDSDPIVLLLDDSSWGNATEDGLRLLRFNIDMENEENTTVEETFIPLSPYDSFPCAATGFGFQCIPQLDGGGLDGLPELILNMPHYRRFDTHEAMVFAFVTDVTDGENVAGIRWTEMRRTEEQDWFVYQEGTFAPDDGLHRFMAGIAIDKFQNIGMGYSVSGPEDYAGLRYTGRRNGDPLGQMTIPETLITDGFQPIEQGGRFGDYTQMSIDAETGSTFWFTGEYAGDIQETQTRIVSFQLSRDSFDLALSALLNPATSNDLSNGEVVEVVIVNQGIEPMSNPQLTLTVDGVEIVTDDLDITLISEESYTHTFTTALDLSELTSYDIVVTLTHPDDNNLNNNVIATTVSNLPDYDIALDATLPSTSCLGENQISLSITNQGFIGVESVNVDVYQVVDNADALIYSETLSSVLEGQGGSLNMVVDLNISMTGDLGSTLR